LFWASDSGQLSSGSEWDYRTEGTALTSYTKERRVGNPNTEVEVARIQWRRAFWQGVWRAVAVIVPAALKYGCIAWGLTKGAEVLIAWTGQDTEASVRLNILVNFLGRRATGYLAPWAVVFATWILYRRERRLKEEAIARMGEADRRYESLMDPGRTSSHLPPSGKSNQGDLP
jgi:hypothetical protein